VRKGRKRGQGHHPLKGLNGQEVKKRRGGKSTWVGARDYVKNSGGRGGKVGEQQGWYPHKRGRGSKE